MPSPRLTALLTKLTPHAVGAPCLYAWQPTRNTNFGDELGPAIVNRCIERNAAQTPNPRRCGTRPKIPRTERKLLSVGSVVGIAQAGDIVWGSGINGKSSSLNYDFRKIDFRAVRGPLTRQLILEYGGECPPVFGDPALLIPSLFPEFRQRTTDDNQGPISFIPNLNDEGLKSRLPRPNTTTFETIPTHTAWKTVVERIIKSRFVIASSLHGIILADAFAVPCRPYQSLFEPLFKFEDHFLATGRDAIQFARSIDEALELGPIPPIQYDSAPLSDAFPIDVFPTH